MAKFEVGKLYNRRQDLHGVYGGQQQGGISTPTGDQVIFLFTGEHGSAYGYEDRPQPDGTFWYTGEGQIDDMTMVRGNRAIRDHEQEGKTLHLFSEARASGHVRYDGEARYLGHHAEERPDREGNQRQAIVFELEIGVGDGDAEAGHAEVEVGAKIPKAWTRPIAELRELAIGRASSTASAKQRRAITYQRSEAVRAYVLRRADGICEACKEPAPFKTRAGRAYLEPHHLRRVADGGPDHPRWVAAICPNCHREAHYGANGDELNEALGLRLADLESGP